MLRTDSRGLLQVAHQLRVIQGHRHGCPAQNIAWPNEHWIAYLARKGFGYANFCEFLPFWLVNLQLIQQSRELMPVLCLIDIQWRGSQNLYSVLVTFHGQIVRNLPSHRDDKPQGSFFLINIGHGLKAQFIKVQFVADIIIRADSFGIIVDHQSLVAHIP